MSPLKITRALAYACGLDAANRSMRAAGRTTWNEEDAHRAAAEFNRLWPLCPHGADPECCYLCDPLSVCLLPSSACPVRKTS